MHMVMEHPMACSTLEFYSAHHFSSSPCWMLIADGIYADMHLYSVDAVVGVYIVGAVLPCTVLDIRAV